MLPPPPSDSVGCVCISVPASIVENNIVRGNQPSVSVLVGGVGIKCCRFCYGMLVLACFTELNPRSQVASEGSEMTLGWRDVGGQGSWLSWLHSLQLPSLLLPTFIGRKRRPRKGSFLPTAHLQGGSSNLRAQVLTSPESGGLSQARLRIDDCASAFEAANGVVDQIRRWVYSPP